MCLTTSSSANNHLELPPLKALTILVDSLAAVKVGENVGVMQYMLII